MKLLLGVLFALATLTACGTGSAGDSSGPGDDGLAGRTFVSADVVGAPTRAWLPGSRVSLSFDSDTRLSASVGCNTMSGPVRLDGGLLALPESLAMTEMGCEPALLAQDQWLTTFLSSRPRYEITGDRLVLTRAGTSITLVDAATPRTPPGGGSGGEGTAQRVVGTGWRLEGIIAGSDETGAVSSIPAGVRSTLRITPNGWLRLDPGCNEARAQVAVRDDTLTVEPLPLTRMGCLGSAGDVERVVLGVVQRDVAYQLDGASLTLRRGATGLVYRAVG